MCASEPTINRLGLNLARRWLAASKTKRRPLTARRKVERRYAKAIAPEPLTIRALINRARICSSCSHVARRFYEGSSVSYVTFINPPISFAPERR
jgi:hypothetical protein